MVVIIVKVLKEVVVHALVVIYKCNSRSSSRSDGNISGSINSFKNSSSCN